MTPETYFRIRRVSLISIVMCIIAATFNLYNLYWGWAHLYVWQRLATLSLCLVVALVACFHVGQIVKYRKLYLKAKEENKDGVSNP